MTMQRQQQYDQCESSPATSFLFARTKFCSRKQTVAPCRPFGGTFRSTSWSTIMGVSSWFQPDISCSFHNPRSCLKPRSQSKGANMMNMLSTNKTAKVLFGSWCKSVELSTKLEFYISASGSSMALSHEVKILQFILKAPGLEPSRSALSNNRRWPNELA